MKFSGKMMGRFLFEAFESGAVGSEPQFFVKRWRHFGLGRAGRRSTWLLAGVLWRLVSAAAAARKCGGFGVVVEGVFVVLRQGFVGDDLLLVGGLVVVAAQEVGVERDSARHFDAADAVLAQEADGDRDCACDQHQRHDHAHCDGRVRIACF